MGTPTRAHRAEPLVRPELFSKRQLVGGLVLFFYQYLIQAGLFFTIPLYLSVALGLSAIDTGVRILPLSLTLLVAAAGIPRFLPNVSPRRVVRLGLLAMLAGIVALFASIDPAAGAEIVTVPLPLAGLGIGALASQLGAVTVSAVPDEESSEVSGLQNTGTNLGASIGTALAGSILIAFLTSSFLTGSSRIQRSPTRSRPRPTSSGRRRALHLRRRPPSRARPGRRERGDRHGGPGGQPAGEAGRAPFGAGGACWGRGAGPLCRPAHPHNPTRLDLRVAFEPSKERPRCPVSMSRTAKV
jgi:hypothetical protein